VREHDIPLMIIITPTPEGEGIVSTFCLYGKYNPNAPDSFYTEENNRIIGVKRSLSALSNQHIAMPPTGFEPALRIKEYQLLRD